MENMLLVGLSRQIALGRELDVIANNVANSATNGFKARSTRFAEHVGEVARAETFENRDRRVSFVVDKGTPIDLSVGAIERTGNGLDVAIRGDAFFEVQTRGGPRWTRDGAFEVNARGELVTQRGELVAGQNGPIRFGPNETGLRIAEDGSVFSDQGQRGKLRLASFANAKALRSEGANHRLDRALECAPCAGDEPPRRGAAGLHLHRRPDRAHRRVAQDGHPAPCRSPGLTAA
jgi:flagellar basal-body rod protein FlgF